MIFIDVIMIICMIITFGIGIWVLVMLINDDCVGCGIFSALLVWACGFLLFVIIPFFVLDKSSGATIGEITSIDKNLGGTTALYIKTNNATEEKYCIEYNQELIDKANELIGKKVKITYGERVGFYFSDKCHQSPVETIEEIKESE